jgi:hypothetical protein
LRLVVLRQLGKISGTNPADTLAIKSEGDKSETQRWYISSDIVRVPDFLDVSAKPFKRQKSNFGEESFRAPEVMRRSSRDTPAR